MPEVWAPPADDELMQAVIDAVEDLNEMQDEIMSDRSYTTGDRRVQIDYWGTRGATRKRQAEVEFLVSKGDWLATLRAAQADYEQGLQSGYGDQWLLGQFVVLREVVASAAKVKPGKVDRHWDEVCRSVRLGLRSDDAYERMWAWSSLADLRVVAMRTRWPLEDLRGSNDVRMDLTRMVQVVGGPDHCPALWPTFRQFWRWRHWWKDEQWARGARAGYDYLLPLVLPRLPARASDGPSPERSRG